MELKKCEKCGTYLMPYKTEDEGIIFLHPFNKECKYNDVTKSVYLQLYVLDETLFREHLKLFPKSTYEIEDVFKAYDELFERFKELTDLYNKEKNKSVWKKIKDSYSDSSESSSSSSSSSS